MLFSDLEDEILDQHIYCILLVKQVTKTSTDSMEEVRSICSHFILLYFGGAVLEFELRPSGLLGKYFNT
jgi:ABC-type Na+ transport system ATPase subunit NatA